MPTSTQSICDTGRGMGDEKKFEFFGEVILRRLGSDVLPVEKWHAEQQRAMGAAPDAEQKIDVLERYGEITGVSGDAYHVQWRGGLHHTFCRETGKCLESPFGEMRGFMIAPEEMARFAKILERNRARAETLELEGKLKRLTPKAMEPEDPTHGARFAGPQADCG